MLDVLKNRTYRHLFAAQVIALAGTGLLTVALGLLAYQLAGERAGAVLGTALAIKMVAYVGVAPIAGAFANTLPRRAFLVAMDLVRAAIALFLPFVTEIWQVYVLIFVLQSASAAFTPTFQATIPDVLPEEKDYTRALSLSRLAYDLENLLSPALAAALLTVISFHWLFGGTVIGFLVSAALVVSVVLPQPKRAERQGGVYDKTTRGLRIYLATPRLRGLLALNLSVAAAGAMVIVNTVVIVRALLGRPENDVALALGASAAARCSPLSCCRGCLMSAPIAASWCPPRGCSAPCSSLSPACFLGRPGSAWGPTPLSPSIGPGPRFSPLGSCSGSATRPCRPRPVVSCADRHRRKTGRPCSRHSSLFPTPLGSSPIRSRAGSGRRLASR